jgi:hypothetical protein
MHAAVESHSTKVGRREECGGEWEHSMPERHGAAPQGSAKFAAESPGSKNIGFLN